MFDDFLRPEAIIVDGRSVRCRVLEASPSLHSSLSLRLPLLLLHGLGCSSDAWLPALRSLAQCRLDCPVFVPDFPGFGGSPGPSDALGIADLADWTTRLMDRIGVERVHLAGNSMGCQVALALARRHPGRVGGLVLVGPTVGERYIPLWRYGLGLLLDGCREPLIYNLVLARMYAQMGIPRYLATTRRMLEDEPLVHAAEVCAPCLILRGDRDGIIPDAVARRLAAALPGGVFRRMRGMPHALPFSHPEAFLDAALAFWAEAEVMLFSPERADR